MSSPLSENIKAPIETIIRNEPDIKLQKLRIGSKITWSFEGFWKQFRSSNFVTIPKKKTDNGRRRKHDAIYKSRISISKMGMPDSFIMVC